MRDRKPIPCVSSFVDLTGQVINGQEVLFYVGKMGSNSGWRVRCHCGSERDVRAPNLVRGKGCRCTSSRRMTELNTTHGASVRKKHSPEYDIWSSMIKRCHPDNAEENPRYAGRGITVCSRWVHGEGGLHGFECFMADMGPKPTPTHSIDRRNNDGNYEPDNCRWATMTEQQRNRSTNHLVNVNGRVITLQEACDLAGLKDVTVHARLRRGWSLDDALNRPLRGCADE